MEINQVLELIKDSIEKSSKDGNLIQPKYITRDVIDYPKLRWLSGFLSGHSGYIAGGCFKNIINGEKVKDIDIFFENEKEQVSAKMYFDKNKDYVFCYQNNKVDAFRNVKNDIVVELIKTKFGTPKDMLNTFDFTITKMAYFIEKILVDGDSEEIINHKIIYHKNLFEDLVMKRIIIDCDKLDMPLGTFNRSLRYTKYGYTMCRNSKLFLVNQILKFAKNNNLEEFSIEDFSRELYDGFD